MSGPIPVMPLDTLRAKVGELIEEAKTRNLPMSTLTLLSIGEYLKDAERWAIVKSQEIVLYPGIMPDDVQRIVDHYIKERENERQRSLCPG